MGIVKAVCISEKKGTAKKNVGECRFIEDWDMKITHMPETGTDR